MTDQSRDLIQRLAYDAYVAFVQICKGSSDDAGTYEQDEALVRKALKRLSEYEACAYIATPEPAAHLPPKVGHILRLAEVIREVDGSHSLGAAALAEAILSHPGSRWQPATPEPAAENIPPLKWTEIAGGPVSYGAVMMQAVIPVGRDNCLNLICEREVVNMVPQALADYATPEPAADFVQKLISQCKPLDPEIAAVLTPSVLWELYDGEAAPEPAAGPTDEELDEQTATLIPWLLDQAIQAANSDAPYAAGKLTLAAQLLGERHQPPQPINDTNG